MEITITLADLGYFVLFALLAVLLIYVVMAVYRLNQVLQKVDRFLDKNSDNLDRTMESIPDILENVNETSEILLHTVDKADTAIDSIGSSLAETAATFRQGANDAAGYVQIITEIISMVRSLISGKK